MNCSLYHAGLTVSDLERAVRFYVDGLGFEEVVRQTSDAPYLALTGYPGVEIAAAFVRLADGTTLELQEYRRVQQRQVREPGTAAVGSSHLCFVVGDLEAALARAERHGGARVTDPVSIDRGINHGAIGVYLRDPDGHTVELFQQPDRPDDGA